MWFSNKTTNTQCSLNTKKGAIYRSNTIYFKGWNHFFSFNFSTVTCERKISKKRGDFRLWDNRATTYLYTHFYCTILISLEYSGVVNFWEKKIFVWTISFVVVLKKHHIVQIAGNFLKVELSHISPTFFYVRNIPKNFWWTISHVTFTISKTENMGKMITINFIITYFQKVKWILQNNICIFWTFMCPYDKIRCRH